MIIGWGRGWLDEKNVLTADILINLGEDFLISKPFNINGCQRNIQEVGNAARQWFIGGTADQFHELIHLAIYEASLRGRWGVVNHSVRIMTDILRP